MDINHKSRPTVSWYPPLNNSFELKKNPSTHDNVTEYVFFWCTHFIYLPICIFYVHSEFPPSLPFPYSALHNSLHYPAKVMQTGVNQQKQWNKTPRNVKGSPPSTTQCIQTRACVRSGLSISFRFPVLLLALLMVGGFVLYVYNNNNSNDLGKQDLSSL